MSIKKAAKRAAQHAVAAVAPTLWKLRREPSLLILMYHRVLPPDHPDRAFEQPGMYVSPQTLDMHLTVLAEHFTFIHLDDWVERIKSGKPVPKNACAITFDDGWRDNYDFAYPVLKRHGCPATIYLVADFVGSTYQFWPNKLARIAATDSIPSGKPEWLAKALTTHRVHEAVDIQERMERLDLVIGDCKKMHTDAEMHAALDALTAGELTHHRDLMDWSEVKIMAADGQIRFGSHTRRHSRLLASLTHEQLKDEIVNSAHIIREQLGVKPRTFCYPNGDDCPEAVQRVREQYCAAVTTQRGWNGRTSDMHLLTRVGMHEGISATYTELLSRLSDWP